MSVYHVSAINNKIVTYHLTYIYAAFIVFSSVFKLTSFPHYLSSLSGFNFHRDTKDFIFLLNLMEGFIGEKSYLMTKYGNNNFESEQIDLTLKLSPCGQEAEEKWVTLTKNYEEEKAESSVVCVEGGENKCLVRFGDLQTMRRMRTGKRLLLEKQRRAAEASKLNSLPNPSPSPSPSPSSHHTQGEGEASSNIKIPLKPSSDDTKLESPTKKLKHVNPYLKKGDAMNILRKMPSVTTTGDGPKGNRIEGLLYMYKGGEISIVCACHGTFLSPAEFVMHAGGNNVADPMKHINISYDSFYVQGDLSECISYAF